MKNKKAVTAEVFAMILLVCALAVIIVLWLIWQREGHGLLEMLSGLFPL